jgi:outer membrane protein
MSLFRRALPSAALAMLLCGAMPAGAETLASALSSAYSNNPTLNAARAQTRATDEGVPQALSGYRPTISAFAGIGASTTEGIGRQDANVGLEVSQPLFRGFRTENGVQAAEALVLASRESLRNTEQIVLLDAVSAYMNVIRDLAIIDLREANIRFLTEQVRAATDRFDVGEGTRTDVAQADASLAAAQSELSLARANLAADRGIYRQVIGVDPNGLAAPSAASGIPGNFEEALSSARTNHPAILSATYAADAAAYNAEVIEGELLPTVSLDGTLTQSWGNGSLGNSESTAAEVGVNVRIPIYEGGAVYSRVREAKEVLGQRRIEVDIARDQVQASLIAAWGTLEASRAQTIAARAQVEAQQLALSGLIEEQRVGQRTTLDVLDAQSDLINARVLQIQAERDTVVASYAVLSAMGRLAAGELGVAQTTYQPEEHYEAVRDAWGGLRTPDGR